MQCIRVLLLWKPYFTLIFFTLADVVIWIALCITSTSTTTSATVKTARIAMTSPGRWWPYPARSWCGPWRLAGPSPRRPVAAATPTTCMRTMTWCWPLASRAARSRHTMSRKVGQRSMICPQSRIIISQSYMKEIYELGLYPFGRHSRLVFLFLGLYITRVMSFEMQRKFHWRGY